MSFSLYNNNKSNLDSTKNYPLTLEVPLKLKVYFNNTIDLLIGKRNITNTQKRLTIISITISNAQNLNQRIDYLQKRILLNNSSLIIFKIY